MIYEYKQRPKLHVKDIVPGAKSYYEDADLHEPRVGGGSTASSARNIHDYVNEPRLVGGPHSTIASGSRFDAPAATPSQPPRTNKNNIKSALLNTTKLDPAQFQAAGGKPPLKGASAAWLNNTWSLKTGEEGEKSTVYRRVYTPKDIDPTRHIAVDMSRAQAASSSDSAPAGASVALPALYVPRAKQSTAKGLIFGGSDHHYETESKHVFQPKQIAVDPSGRGALRGKDARSSWKMSDGGPLGGPTDGTAYQHQFTLTTDLKETARNMPRCGEKNTKRAPYNIIHGGPGLTNFTFEAWEPQRDYRRVINFIS